jgi:hypothetical protein
MSLETLFAAALVAAVAFFWVHWLEKWLARLVRRRIRPQTACVFLKDTFIDWLREHAPGDVAILYEFQELEFEERIGGETRPYPGRGQTLILTFVPRACLRLAMDIHARQFGVREFRNMVLAGDPEISRAIELYWLRRKLGG